MSRTVDSYNSALMESRIGILKTVCGETAFNRDQWRKPNYFPRRRLASLLLRESYIVRIIR